jgi:hypothetical protein
MGQQQSTLTKTDVENYISQAITLTNSEVLNLLNSNTTNVINNIQQTNANDVETSGSCQNLITLIATTIRVGPYAKFKICNTCNINAINQASIMMTQDASSITELAHKLSTAILQQIQSNASLNTTTQNALNITNALQQNGGGIAGLAQQILEPLNNLCKIGSLTNFTMNTTNINKIMTDLKLNTTQTTDIQNLYSTIINNAITQNNLSNCRLNFSLSNIQYLNGDNITTEVGSDFDMCDNHSAQYVQHCILNQVQQSAIQNNLLNDTSNNTTQTASNNATGTVDLSNNIVSQLENALTTYGNYIMGIIGFICRCVCCIFILYAAMKMQNN